MSCVQLWLKLSPFPQNLVTPQEVCSSDGRTLPAWTGRTAAISSPRQHTGDVWPPSPPTFASEHLRGDAGDHSLYSSAYLYSSEVFIFLDVHYFLKESFPTMEANCVDKVDLWPQSCILFDIRVKFLRCHSHLRKSTPWRRVFLKLLFCPRPTQLSSEPTANDSTACIRRLTASSTVAPPIRDR